MHVWYVVDNVVRQPDMTAFTSLQGVLQLPPKVHGEPRFILAMKVALSRYGDGACLWLQLDVEGLRCSALTAQRSTFCGVYALCPLVP